jgi:hypothetical protein
VQITTFLLLLGHHVKPWDRISFLPELRPWNSGIPMLTANFQIEKEGWRCEDDGQERGWRYTLMQQSWRACCQRRYQHSCEQNSKTTGADYRAVYCREKHGRIGCGRWVFHGNYVRGHRTNIDQQILLFDESEELRLKLWAHSGPIINK